ncbi:hypothetical protein GPALN_005918 [Globodera pallida]|nr:hypothetical protein GPALN_005918 [Globodera pallida]
MSTIAAVLMTILALFAVCNAMLEDFKPEKSVKFYKVEPKHFRNLDAATVLSLSEIKPSVSIDVPSSDQLNSNMINFGDSSWSNTNTQTSNYSTQNFSNTAIKRKSSPKSASKNASKKKATSSTTSHNFNQSQSDQSSMQFHPVQDQSMQFHPVQDQSSSWYNDNSDPNDGLLGSITKLFAPK